MKNFPLQDLELHIDDGLIERAEQLVSRQQGIRLEQVQPFLWVARFDTQPLIEAEIQLGRKYVKGVSCDCQEFQQEDICQHITAALLECRHLKNQQEEQKEQKRWSTPKNSKLTTAAILRDVDEHALKNFIREYAKSNRAFALSLKIRFADRVPHPDPQQKYGQLISSILALHKRPGKKLSRGAFSQLSQLMDELYRQSEFAFLEHNWHTSFIIIQAAFEQLLPVLSHSPELPTKLVKALTNCLQLTEDILSQSPAPQLATAILHFHYEYFDSRSLLQHGLSQIGLQLLMDQQTDPAKRLQLLEKLKATLLQTDQFSDAFMLLLFALLELLLQLNSSRQAIEQALATLALQSSTTLQALNRLVEASRWPLVKVLANFGLRQYNNTRMGILFKKALLQATLHSQQPDACRKLAKELILEAHDFEAFGMLKKSYKKGWQSQLASLLRLIQQQAGSAGRDHLLAKIYQAEGRWSDLEAHILASGSFELLMEYDEDLEEQDAAATFRLYERLLGDYLEGHVGRLAAVQTRGMIAHLLKSGYTQWAEQLVSQLRQNYADRRSLMEELAEY